MAAASERKRGTPDAFSTLLWNNEPRKSNEILSRRPTRKVCSGAKAALSFSREDQEARGPLANDHSFQRREHRAPF